MKSVRGQGFSVRFTRRGMAVRNEGAGASSQQNNAPDNQGGPSVIETKLGPVSAAPVLISTPPSAPVKPADDIFATIAAMAQDAARQRKEEARDKGGVNLERMLRAAAKDGNCAVIRRLVMAGVDLDARDDGGRTALNIATQYNRTQAIKTLLAAREMRRMAALGELPKTAFFEKFQKKSG